MVGCVFPVRVGTWPAPPIVDLLKSESEIIFVCGDDVIVLERTDVDFEVTFGEADDGFTVDKRRDAGAVAPETVFDMESRRVYAGCCDRAADGVDDDTVETYAGSSLQLVRGGTFDQSGAA
mmetsp:Transcript_1880/g.3347  ORF Transcript_1880/g.3347 Transcript_1880/m.3347 type:complete len:121 (-) Transcript_1880:864-1226(-)